MKKEEYQSRFGKCWRCSAPLKKCRCYNALTFEQLAEWVRENYSDKENS